MFTAPATIDAINHGLELSEKWNKDQTYNQHKSKTGKIQFVAFVRPEHEQVAFKSKTDSLRGDFGDSWGYLIPDLVEGIHSSIPEEVAQPAKRGRGRPAKPRKNRAPLAGAPNMDSGASGLIPVSKTCLPLPVAWKRVQAIRRELKDYDQPTKIKGVDYCRSHISHKTRSRHLQTLLERITVDLIPGLSRAVQRMLEKGMVAEARQVMDVAMPLILAEFERLYPGAKVVGAAWHVHSGQLHVDIWAHSTRLDYVLDHKSPKLVLARLWDAMGLCHYGPGPGICAWDRHARALGKEVAEVAPGLALVVEDGRRVTEQNPFVTISRLARPSPNRWAPSECKLEIPNRDYFHPLKR